MKSFNNLFSIGFDISDCDREDLSIVSGLFVTESITEAELWGFTITLSKIPVDKNQLSLSDSLSKIIVVKNSRGEIITTMTITSDMFEELKTSIQAQIPLVEKQIDDEEALIATCHAKEYGTKPECMNCVLRSSCALLYNADKAKTVVDNSIDLTNARLDKWREFNKERHEYCGEVITADGNRYHVYLAFKRAPLGALSLMSLHGFMVFRISDAGELLTDNEYDVPQWDKINMVEFSLKGF